MSTITDPAVLADKIRRAATAMEAIQAITVKEIAQAGKDAIQPKINTATGGNRMLSGTQRTKTNRKGVTKSTREKTISVSYRIRDGVAGPTALLRATGPLQLVENDVKRHVVVSSFARAAGYETTILTGKNAGKTRAGRNTRDARIASVLTGAGTSGTRRAVLNFGDGTYRRWTTSHSTGRHPWKRGVDEMGPNVLDIHARNQRKALLSVFDA
jgi:hypothetical protein